MKYKDVEINWLGHSGFKIKKEFVVYIDPFQINSNEKADMILISHSHYDHCSIEDLKKIVKSTTIILGPPDILSNIRQLNDLRFEIFEPGKEFNFENINVKAVFAYNINKQFHPKDERWMGFVVDVNGIKIYHTGDSDFIPEMKNIKCDVALIPISGKFVMDVNEAVNAVLTIKPELVIPMHYGSIIGDKNQALEFVTKCKENKINAVILEKA